MNELIKQDDNETNDEKDKDFKLKNERVKKGGNKT
jgi:hypothetical protein